MENKQMNKDEMEINMDEMGKVAGGTLHDTPNDVFEPLKPTIDVRLPKDNTKVPGLKLGEKDPTIIGDPTESMIK